MNKNKIQDSVRSIARWVGLNSAWDFIKWLFGFLSSAIITWIFSVQPKFFDWLSEMNIPAIIAIAGMFLGFGVIVWAVLSAIGSVINKLVMRLKKKPNKVQEFKEEKEIPIPPAKTIEVSPTILDRFSFHLDERTKGKKLSGVGL